MTAERELRLKATTEGTEKAAQDFKKIADAEKKVTDAQTDAGDSAKKMSVNQEALIQTLNNISPALGGMVDGMLKAATVAGDLGKASFSTTDIISGARAAVLKYKDALVLLGAGGAAAAAVLFLVAQWRRLREEMEGANRAQQEFNEDNRFRIDKARDVEKQIAQAIEGGELAPSAADDIARIRKAKQGLIGRGVSDDLAFRISAGLAPPIPESGLKSLDQLRGFVSQRRRAGEEFERGTLSTESVNLIRELTGLGAETIKQAQELLRTGEFDQTFATAVRTTVNELVDRFRGDTTDSERGAFRSREERDAFRVIESLGLVDRIGKGAGSAEEEKVIDAQGLRGLLQVLIDLVKKGAEFGSIPIGGVRIMPENEGRIGAMREAVNDLRAVAGDLAAITDRAVRTQAGMHYAPNGEGEIS